MTELRSEIDAVGSVALSGPEHRPFLVTPRLAAVTAVWLAPVLKLVSLTQYLRSVPRPCPKHWSLNLQITEARLTNKYIIRHASVECHRSIALSRMFAI